MPNAFMLYFLILGFNMLSFVIPRLSLTMLNVVILRVTNAEFLLCFACYMNAAILSVVMLGVVMLGVVILSVVMLGVVVLSIAEPFVDTLQFNDWNNKVFSLRKTKKKF